MDNLEPDWNFFSAISLTLAKTSDHFALRICAVDLLKNEPKTAETLIKIKRCLAAAKISVEVFWFLGQLMMMN